MVLILRIDVILIQLISIAASNGDMLTYTIRGCYDQMFVVTAMTNLNAASSIVCQQSPISHIGEYQRQTRICYCNQRDFCNNNYSDRPNTTAPATDRNIIAGIILSAIIILIFIILLIWCNGLCRRCRSTNNRRSRPLVWVHGVFSSNHTIRYHRQQQSTDGVSVSTSTIPYTKIV
jgi:hypothetical protein